jgi:hypothetical protein
VDVPPQGVFKRVHRILREDPSILEYETLEETAEHIIGMTGHRKDWVISILLHMRDAGYFDVDDEGNQVVHEVPPARPPTEVVLDLNAPFLALLAGKDKRGKDPTPDAPGTQPTRHERRNPGGRGRGGGRRRPQHRR